MSLLVANIESCGALMMVMKGGVGKGCQACRDDAKTSFAALGGEAGEEV